jgi:hypothetical protein
MGIISVAGSVPARKIFISEIIKRHGAGSEGHNGEREAGPGEMKVRPGVRYGELDHSCDHEEPESTETSRQSGDEQDWEHNLRDAVDDGRGEIGGGLFRRPGFLTKCEKGLGIAPRHPRREWAIPAAVSSFRCCDGTAPENRTVQPVP